ncbi:MAG: NADH-quinone oxidoreductase subunit N [Candidatus Hodarchaeales archaeon]|jgi:NADH-quinone oxidoreductase subunit N
MEDTIPLGVLTMDELLTLFTYWPLTIILVTAIVILLESYFNFKRQYMTYTALLGLIIALIMIYLPNLENFQPIFISWAENPGYNNSLIVIDKLTLLFTAIFIIAAFYVIITANKKLSEEEDSPGIFYILLLLATCGMILISATTDLLTLFVTWELLALPGYALVAYYTREKLPFEAALKYFILGGASAGILLFGMSILYGFSGTTNIYMIFSAIATQTEYLPFLIIGLVAIIAGLGFEIGIVPFHWWLPDALEGTSPAVAQMLTIGSKKAGFGAIFRILLIPLFMVTSVITDTSAMYQVIHSAQILLAVAAIMTMTLGNVAALKQRNIVRLLAYSSIAQAGYILIAVAVAVATPDQLIAQLALFAGIFHIFTHTLMKGGAFAIVVMLLIVGNFKSIDDLTGIAKRSRWLAFAFGVILLSLAGIPPLLGFWSKVTLFLSAVAGNLWWLAVAALLNSALSLFYYARIIKIMYIDLDEVEESPVKLNTIPRYYWIPVGFTVIALIGIGLFPVFLVNELYKVAGDVLSLFLATISP